MLHIGLAGKRGSGKDTVAAYLVERYGYTRVAFADRVRDAALALDPYVAVDTEGQPVRLSHMVDVQGWNQAKQHEEVRRVLQRIGDEAGRQIHGPYTWINQALEKIKDIDGPIVFSDVRYPNEIDELRKLGFVIVQIFRPAKHQRQDLVDLHPSETDLRARCDEVIFNDGSIEDLYVRVDQLLESLTEADSEDAA